MKFISGGIKNLKGSMLHLIGFVYCPVGLTSPYIVEGPNSETNSDVISEFQ